MNYPYYDELARHLESKPEDMSSCSTSNVYQNTGHTSGERDATHVYQNVVPLSGEHILHNATKNIFSGVPLHANPAMQNGVITGVVRLILPSHSFTRKNGTNGAVQAFIVVDTLAKRMNSAVWRYKIVAWDEQAKNLSVEQGRT